MKEIACGFYECFQLTCVGVKTFDVFVLSAGPLPNCEALNNSLRRTWTSIIESYPLWKTCSSDLMTSLINIQCITRLTSSQDLH